MTRINRTVLTAIFFGLFSAVSFGGYVNVLDGNPVMNPSGDVLAPEVYYESDTGLLFIDTLGTNGLLDTTIGTSIGGDDIGMISFKVDLPTLASTDVGFLLSGFQIYYPPAGGVFWNTMFFNQSAQLFGIGAGAEYAAPMCGLNLLQLPTNLVASDFGTVEIGVNFAAGVAGGTLISDGTMPAVNIITSNLRCIPEPATVSLMGAALLVIVGAYRTKR